MSRQRKQSKVTKKGSNIRARYRADGTVRGYEARYRDPEEVDSRGRPLVRGKIFRTLIEAQEFQKRKAVEILDGEHISPERQKTKWKQIAEDWLETKAATNRARTVSGYKNVLDNWLSVWDKRAIGDITTADVRVVIRDVRKAGRAVGTERHIFNAIHGVFEFAVDEGLIKTNPASAFRKRLRKPSEDEYEGIALTTDQAEAIIEELPDGRYRLYGRLGLWTGLRAGELAGLRVRNLDIDRSQVQVEETIQDLGGKLSPGTTKTKRSKGRRVPIPPALMQQVIEFATAEGLGADDYVFAGKNPYFRHANFYRRHWKPACEKAGLPGTRFHTLRHTFISLRSREGIQPAVLMQWAGHTTMKMTTDRYTHPYDSDLRDVSTINRMWEEQQRPTLRVVEDEAS